ncbi:MAG: hypothetical protein KDC66_17385 [Phaeodactylibacter sp.]|nr:hypothetical protein [Phaeodactylibacter sp.]
MNTQTPKGNKAAGPYFIYACLVGGVVFFARHWPWGETGPPSGLPCEAGAEAYLSANDSLLCCYSLSYSFDPAAGPATAVETELLTAGASFSAVQYPLTSGWSYQSFSQGRRLRWSHTSGLPAGTQPLFDFCIDAPQTGFPVELAVNWLVGGETRCSDTLRLACYHCLAPQNDSLTCLADGGYSYTFNLVNLTDYTIHRLRLTEPAGQSLVVEEFLDLAGPWAPGTTAGSFNITLSPEAEGMDNLCFELTASRLLGDSLALDCCTFTHCLELPLCDRCCTPFEEFEADVNAGFTVSADCETGFLTAVYQRWGACDRVFWNLRNLNTGTGIGGFVNNSTITFTFLDETPYQLCMRVERRDAGGVNCYGSSTITICDTLFFDCPDPPCLDSSLIDWSFDCPLVLELVCGCDSMTYINSCAAMNWSGVLGLDEGPCGEPPVDSIILEIVAFDPGQALLQWASLGGVDYRFFLVQRRLPGGGWATVGQADGTTFFFTDNDPAPGLNEYRIVGVTWPGKPVFSNVEEIFITGTYEAGWEGEGRLWPNPARHTAYLQLPWPGPAVVWAFDVQGRLRSEWWLPGAFNRAAALPVGGWPAGLYVLKARSPDGKIWAGRLAVTP